MRGASWASSELLPNEGEAGASERCAQCDRSARNAGADPCLMHTHHQLGEPTGPGPLLGLLLRVWDLALVEREEELLAFGQLLVVCQLLVR